jgi:hypothetical protein
MMAAKGANHEEVSPMSDSDRALRAAHRQRVLNGSRHVGRGCRPERLRGCDPESAGTSSPCVPAGDSDSNTGITPATLSELARARRATAKYHDVANAEADGYINVNLYTPGEGYHFVNESLIDTTFDVEKPEVLLYANGPYGDGLRLRADAFRTPSTGHHQGTFLFR